MKTTAELRCILRMKKYRKLNLKISFFFLILVVIIAIVMGALTYTVSYYSNMIYSISLLERCGNYVDRVVDADRIKEWMQYGTDITYELIKSDLDSIREEFGLSYLFVYKPTIDKSGIVQRDSVIIFDLNPENIDPSRVFNFGDHYFVETDYEQLQRVFDTGKPQTSSRYTPTNNTELIITLCPLRLDDGEIYAVAGVCGSLDRIKSIAIRSSVTLVTIFEIMVLLFAIVFLFYVQRRIVHPVKKLSSSMDKFVSSASSEGFVFMEVTDINTRDEIEQMTDNFNSMAQSMIKYTEDLKSMTTSRERLKAELDVAGSIRSTVSAELAFPAFSERSDFELFASLKNTVYNSCSFCNYFLTDENHLFIVIGESVGKTLPGMLMSMLTSTNICALAKMGVEPYRIAYETSESIGGFEHEEMSMTVSALIVMIDLSKGEMKYVNAGMPPIIIKETGKPYASLNEGIQFNLGEMKGVSFKQNTIRLNQGSSIFLTSYGVSEMKNSDGEKFSEERVVAAINEIAHENYPLQEMISELESRLDRYRGGAASELDTTILGFRYFG